MAGGGPNPTPSSGRGTYVHETTGECTWDPPVVDENGFETGRGDGVRGGFIGCPCAPRVCQDRVRGDSRPGKTRLEGSVARSAGYRRVARPAHSGPEIEELVVS